jgi:hypothetical protein
MSTNTIAAMTATEFDAHLHTLAAADAPTLLLVRTIRAGYGCTRPEAEKIVTRLKATHRHALTHRA